MGTAYIELKFKLPELWDFEEKVFRLNQTEESIQRLVLKENEASYALYKMAMNYTEETTSLLIEIKHLESGRDFEVTLGEEWLKKQFPEKYNIHNPSPAPISNIDPLDMLSSAEIKKKYDEQKTVFKKYETMLKIGQTLQMAMNRMKQDGIDKSLISLFEKKQIHEKEDIDGAAVNAMFGNEDSSDDSSDDDDDDDVVMEDVTEKKPDTISNDDGKEKEPEPEPEPIPEPTPEPEVHELAILMDCIQKSMASHTLKMTMKGWSKKALIELRFAFNGTFIFNEKETVISREEVIEVKRSKECIEKQTEMEQKEEEKQEVAYIAGIQGVSESGYGQYCAIEGLVDRHTFKSHKNDKPDPQSVNSRKIMRELRKTLAKGVYLSYTNGSMFVRFDESNPRFLQAMLIGLKGTPYYNGCFLFDIYLPDEYPQKPCKVKHVSNGAQLCHANNGPGGFSPNLHQSSGKVCLSLLGTWSGPGWEPNKSNVYQLLSTLLLMVFGAEHPYYMEPSYGGWEGTAYGKTKHDPKVIQYDEEVLYHTAKSVILEMMKKPYPGFEDIIKTHFRLKKDQIKNHMQDMLHAEQYSASFKKKVKPIYDQIEAELEKL